MQSIRETATLTSKGQLTLPKAIRKALGVTTGSRLTFEFQGEHLIVRRLEEHKHRDPAITHFLTLIAKDLHAGKRIGDLPEGLQKSMDTMLGISVDLDEEISGEVDL
jgi:antitoxin PrlF